MIRFEYEYFPYMDSSDNWIGQHKISMDYEEFVQKLNDSEKYVHDIIWNYPAVEDERQVDYGSEDQTEKLSGFPRMYTETLVNWLGELNKGFGVNLALTESEVTNENTLEISFETDVTQEEYDRKVNTPHTPSFENLDDEMIEENMYWVREENPGDWSEDIFT